MKPAALPIVSFPKSGRTWLRYAAGLAGIEPEFTHAGHTSSVYDIGTPFKGIPKDMAGEPVLFLHRNPLDTAVSYFMQIIHKDCIPGHKTWIWMENNGAALPPVNIDAFVLHRKYGLPLIMAYNRAWLHHLKTVPGSVVLTYEQFKSDPVPTFTRFFEALGHSDVDVKETIRQTTFEKMRALQSSGEGDVWRVRQRKTDEESAKVRKGKVRGYVDYLQPHTIRVCKRLAAKRGFEI